MYMYINNRSHFNINKSVSIHLFYFRINFTNVGIKILKVHNLNESDYEFDICKNEYQKCSYGK